MNTLKSLTIVAIVSALLMQYALVQIDKTAAGAAIVQYAAGSLTQIEYLGE
jgi:hypothetical protein